METSISGVCQLLRECAESYSKLSKKKFRRKRHTIFTCVYCLVLFWFCEWICFSLRGARKMYFCDALSGYVLFCTISQCTVLPCYRWSRFIVLLLITHIFGSFCFVPSLDLYHVNDYSNTNWLTDWIFFLFIFYCCWVVVAVCDEINCNL